MIVAPGTTSVSVDVFFADDTGAAVTGKVAADFPVCKWSGGSNTADTTITLTDLAAITTAHPNDNTAGGIKEREGGWYRLDLPNNMITAAGNKRLTFAETTNKRIMCEAIIVANVPADVKTWLTVAPAALSTNGYVKTVLLRWLTDDTAGTPVALSTNGYLQTMLLRWLTDNAAGTPVALSTNGLLQIMVMRWLTDNAGGTPDALSSGKMPADVKLWLTTAPATVSTNGYVKTVVLRWLTDDAGGTPDALVSGKLPADVKKWLAATPAALSTNGYAQAMLVRWLTDDAAGTPNALTANKNLPSAVIEWISTVLTESAVGRFIGGMKQYFNVASPASTMEAITRVVDLTNLPAVPTDWLTAAGVKSDAVTKIQSGLATAANVSATQAAILAVLGTPSASLAADITAIYTIVNSGSYGNSALLSALQNIQNNTFISTSIPGTLERPDSGSVTVGITLLFCDETGAAKNLDSGNPTITLTNDATTDMSSRLGSISNPSTGKYTLNYTSSVTDTIEGLHWEVTGTVNSKLRRYVAYMQIVDTTAVSFTSTDRTNMGTILSRISGPVALEASLQALIATIGVAGAGLTAADDAVIAAIAALYNISPAQVRTAIGLASANLDTQLDTITGKVANLPASPASTSDVTSARDTILSKLLKYVQLLFRKDAAVATDNSTELTAINSNGGSGGGDANPTTDSLQAIRDHGDAAWITAVGFSTLTAAEVWSYVDRQLSEFGFTPALDEAYDRAKNAVSFTEVSDGLQAIIDLLPEAADNESIGSILALANTINDITTQFRFAVENRVDATASFTLSDEQIASLAAILGPIIWQNDYRTLTYPSGGALPPGEGPDIVVVVATDWTFDITDLGSLEGSTKLLFTAKSSLSDSDEKAYVQVEETEGLIRIAGAAGSSGSATITINDAVAGNITVTVSAAATAALRPMNGLYDMKKKNGAGKWLPLPGGKFTALPIVTRTVD